MIVIDGREGGGQVLRYALAFATYTKQPVRVHHIRATRPRPGLAVQHIAGIEVLQQLTSAKCTDVYLGSQEITFFPGEKKARSIHYELPTAGSVTLVLQSLVLPLCFLPGRTKVTLSGGTDVRWALPWDTFQNVLLSYLKRYAKWTPKLFQRGYYPKGGGTVELSVHRYHEHIPPLDIQVPRAVRIVKGVAHASTDLGTRYVAERLCKGAEVYLKQQGIPVTLRSEYSTAESSGCGLSLWCLCSRAHDVEPEAILSSDVLGEPRERAESVGKRAAEHMVATMNHDALDVHTVDALIPFLAVAGGSCVTERMSTHIKNAIAVARHFSFDVSATGTTIRARRV